MKIFLKATVGLGLLFAPMAASAQSCQDFFASGGNMDYIVSVEQQADMAAVARGCQSVMGDWASSEGNRKFVWQMCQGDPRQTQYSLAMMMYSLARSNASAGMGNGACPQS